MTVRLLIADDHPLILDGIANLLQLERDFQLLERCSDGLEALDAIRRERPDVAILDIRMPGMTGLAVSRALLSEQLPTRVVLFAAELNDDQLLEAMRTGVRGIVLKEMAPRLLIQCIRKVHAGERWIERQTTSLSFEKLLRREAAKRETESLLTPREIQMVRMLAMGLRNREIGDRLCISENTVKTHLHNIYEKLQVDSRLALLRYAQQKGIT